MRICVDYSYGLSLQKRNGLAAVVGKKRRQDSTTWLRGESAADVTINSAPPVFAIVSGNVGVKARLHIVSYKAAIVGSWELYDQLRCALFG